MVGGAERGDNEGGRMDVFWSEIRIRGIGSKFTPVLCAKRPEVYARESQGGSKNIWILLREDGCRKSVAGPDFSGKNSQQRRVENLESSERDMPELPYVGRSVEKEVTGT